MRNSKSYKLLASIVLVASISVSSANVFAQRRSHKEDKVRYEERKPSNRLRTYDRKEKYNKNTYQAKAKHQRNHHSQAYKKQKYHQYKHVKSYARRPYAKHYYDRHARYYPRHNQVHYRYRQFYNQYGNRCYNHNRYGDVVIRFAVEPTVIPYQYGDYYFSEGDYYKYYPEVGYVMVDAPRSLYFSYLPNTCRRMIHSGNVYYTDGDLCFVKYRRGFRLVKTPARIQLSFRF
ncbi:hypothetical protein [Ancylomarina longa]|uniref:Uncharacterized protein n=1 Tax=Ancylomarina longa TaxID=2487017 RepID=A0A434AG74_9BACT|nr:hypothetical protein [Ancylomarina longa]RUT73388.1 hypothetical protein DLK05_13545 [Ancylomarina longa]